MNIVNRLTLRHLQANKSRSVITTLGICVSVAMITAVFVAIASFMQLFGDISVLSTGNWHVQMVVDEVKLKKLKADERFAEIGVRKQEEYCDFQLSDRASERLGSGTIYTGDQTNLEQMVTGSYTGTLPKNENEIAVEQSLIEKNHLHWQLGDTVTIPLGTFSIIDEESGEPIITDAWSATHRDDGKFTQLDSIDVRITAVLQDNPATANEYSILRGLDSTAPIGAGETLTAYARLKTVNARSLTLIKDIIKEYDISEYTINNDYLESKFAIDENSNFVRTFIPMAAVVLALIVIASVVLIYNAFGMSLAERVRYLGMLASVGATKKQKRLSVYGEGFLLGAVGIPVGILAGVVGIGITLKAIGSKVISTGMLSGVSADNVEMQVAVPVWVIVGIVIISLMTIFISAFIPAHKASQITPIDAIRQRQEIRIKAKKLKSPKMIRKIFGYEGELAYKNLKRNGRKSRIITASIALSVILFLSCNYFCSLFVQALEMEANVPYQIQTYVEYDKREAFFDELDKIEEIEEYYCTNYDFIELSETSQGEAIYDKSLLTNTYKSLFNGDAFLYVNYIDDERFNQLCADNGIDPEPYYGDTVQALLLNNISHETGGAKVFNDKILGKKIVYNEQEVLTVSGFIQYDAKNEMCNLNPNGSISVYVPISTYFQAQNLAAEDFTYMVGIKTDEHAAVAEQLNTLLEEHDFGGSYVSDYVDSLQVMHTIVFILEVFVYGFIALITLITVANIINTISTGIQLRRREFAMLQSVGTTPKGFRKMVSLESVFYALKALAFALPISILISFALNHMLSSNTIPFELDFALYLAVSAVVFALTGVTMLYAVWRIRDDSIVETLKTEIR